MKNFKKITALLSVLVILISATACTADKENESEATSKPEDNTPSIAGEYILYDLYNDIIFSGGGRIDNIREKSKKFEFVAGDKKTEGTLDGGLYHNFTWTVKDDILTLEVSEDKTGAGYLEVGSKTDYLIYDNYLIDTTPMYNIAEGEADISNGKLDIVYEDEDVKPEIDYEEYFCIGLYSDNTCELEAWREWGEDTSYYYYLEGTYTLDGNIVKVEMDYIEDEDGKIDGSATFCLYIDDDGELFTTLYKKIA